MNPIPLQRKLRYLRAYMHRFIDYWPHYKLVPFEVFVDLEERKRRQRKQEYRKRVRKKKPQPLLAAHPDRCAYCERLFSSHGGMKQEYRSRTREHILPKHLGGGDENNIVWACYSCNQWKGGKEISEWLQEVMAALMAGNQVFQHSGGKLLPTVYYRGQLEKIVVNIRKVQQAVADRLKKGNSLERE